MFYRSNRPDGDVVAAAQRRLAALSELHRQPPSSPTSDDDEDRPRPRHVGAPSGSPDIPLPTPRHLGPRRTEFGRWAMDAPQVAVAAMLVVALVVAIAWWVLRSAPHAEPVQMSSQHLSSSDSTAGEEPSSTAAGFSAQPGAGATPVGPAATSSRLVVDVAGKVRHPGIVELPAGARVVDAIAAAGGARAGVSLISLNLARPLVDGEQIVVGVHVPFVGGAGLGGAGVPGSPGASAPVTVAPVNLNTATAEQLDTLPGVGPVTAQAILQWRVDNGAFVSVDDLLDVSGIGSATLADLRPYVYV